MKLKRMQYVFFIIIIIILKTDKCSATSFKRSLRELSIGIAERRPILENNQNMYNPRFNFIPKTELPETDV